MPAATPSPAATNLARRLGLPSAILIVLGLIIGSGIFLTPQNIAAAVQVPGLMIVVWVVSGLLTLAGALTNAEIAAEITESGGQYVYFRVLYRDWMAFLYGWTSFIVYQTASIAAIAVAFARYLEYFVPLPHLSPALEAWQLPLFSNITPLADFGVKAAAILSILLLTWVNYRGVEFGAAVQNVFTALKVLALGGIVVFAFTSAQGSVANFFPLWGAPPSGNWLAAVGVAMIAALWCYDGWNNLTYIAGEVKEPQKNIPRALVLGTLATIALYLLINLAFLYVMPITEIAASKLVAAEAMAKVLGPWGGGFIALTVMISTFGIVNTTCLTASRLYQAMAQDRLFFAGYAEIHPVYRTPGKALLAQGVWSALLTFTGTYEQLFLYAIFAAWIFYALGAAGIFVLRRKFPNPQRAYATPGYPLVPLLFVLVATWFVINTLIEQTADSLVGLLLVLAGLPFYLYWKRQLQSTFQPEQPS
ncbi:amino acid permease [candidate division KSB1 bacterium]|nr:amino acid permease [bacterium]NUM65466.1 amino acid permease [candidate division KSB1 bacterium]